jgi:phosphate transport system ATP-binding protein
MTIEFQNYGLVLDDFRLLRDVSFSIGAGESVALVGPTGSGKSLLLKVMQQSLWRVNPWLPFARQTKWQQSGSLKIMDLVCGPDRPSQKTVRTIQNAVAMVAEHSEWLPSSVADNFLVVQRRAGLENPLRYEQIVDEYAQSSRNRALLMSFAEQYPAQIELPYLQYLNLIRALVCQPKVILLDEALIRLDPILLRQAETLLYEKSGSTTLIWATNDLYQASRVTDRTLFLIAGTVCEDSETPKFFANPRTSQAEAFISGRELESET